MCKFQVLTLISRVIYFAKLKRESGRIRSWHFIFRFWFFFANLYIMELFLKTSRGNCRTIVNEIIVEICNCWKIRGANFVPTREHVLKLSSSIQVTICTVFIRNYNSETRARGLGSAGNNRYDNRSDKSLMSRRRLVAVPFFNWYSYYGVNICRMHISRAN